MKIFKENSSSERLKTRYGAEGFISSFGAMNLSTVHQVKQRLIESESLSELGSIRSGIEAQLDFFKQLSIILAIVTFLISTILNPLTFYLQQSLKPVDWIHQAKMGVIETAASNLPESERENYIATHLNIEIEEYTAELHNVQKAHYKMLSFMVIPLIFIFFLLFAKYKWLGSVFTCVNEAFKEKEKIESAVSVSKEISRLQRENRLRKK